MRFYSKKGPIITLITWFLLIILLGSIIALLISGINDPDSLFGLIILIVSFIFILWLWFNTYYEVTKTNELKVVAGPFKYALIEIHSIKGIERTKNIVSSPALSMDRIEIHYNKWHTIIISPKHEKQFIEKLQNINPEITVKS
ncbi:hypothetical protein J6TS2_05210 [Heyndrickxia sporothermodurans]|nr:hypothetical protein J6TS2_05210 [Heyndrickxia sporothermodurans]